MNTHMPSCAVSPCWDSVAYCISGWRLRIYDAVLGREAAVLSVVEVGARGDDRCAFEIVLRRRRGNLPFQPGGAPRVGPRPLAAKQRPAQVAERQDIRKGQDRRAG